MLSSVLANFLLQFHYHSFDCLIFFRVLFGIKFSSTSLTFTFLFSHNSSTFLSIFLLPHFTSSQLFSTIPINCIYKRSILLTSLLHQFINSFLFICNVLVDGFSSIQFYKIHSWLLYDFPTLQLSWIAVILQIIFNTVLAHLT